MRRDGEEGFGTGGEEPHVTGADARIAGGGRPDAGPDGEGARAAQTRSQADLEREP